MSTDLIGTFQTIPAMTDEVIAHVRRVEEHILQTQWQVIDLKMEHLIHGGMYHRTCCIPAGHVITGALVRIATTLTISGDCLVWIGGEEHRITGYAVIRASAGRKQVFRAIADTHVTMAFPTKAQTVPECEREFTGEAHLLAPGCAETVITGED